MPSRTVLAAIGSVVGVILAGTAAVSANLGILTAADSTGLGELSAVSTTMPLEPEIIDVYLDDILSGSDDPGTPNPGGSSPAASSTFEAFLVDVAGQVTIENSGDRIEVAQVASAACWTYSTSVVSATEVTVTFEGVDTFVFGATLLPDGTIAASVDRPIVIEGAVPAPRVGDDDYHDDDHDDDYDDDDDDDDDYDDDEHEGGDDDD